MSVIMWRNSTISRQLALNSRDRVQYCAICYSSLQGLMYSTVVCTGVLSTSSVPSSLLASVVMQSLIMIQGGESRG